MSTGSNEPRYVEPLTTEECWSYLRTNSVGRLGVNVGSQPDIFPVNYVIDADEIVIRTQAGTKLAAAIMGNAVAFEIDALDESTHSGWSVVVHGKASEPKGLEEVMHDDALDLEPWSDGEKPRYIHISVTEISGRRIPPTTH